MCFENFKIFFPSAKSFAARRNLKTNSDYANDDWLYDYERLGRFENFSSTEALKSFFVSFHRPSVFLYPLEL